MFPNVKESIRYRLIASSTDIARDKARMETARYLDVKRATSSAITLYFNVSVVHSDPGSTTGGIYPDLLEYRTLIGLSPFTSRELITVSHRVSSAISTKGSCTITTMLLLTCPMRPSTRHPTRSCSQDIIEHYSAFQTFRQSGFSRFF